MRELVDAGIIPEDPIARFVTDSSLSFSSRRLRRGSSILICSETLRPGVLGGVDNNVIYRNTLLHQVIVNIYQDTVTSQDKPVVKVNAGVACLAPIGSCSVTLVIGSE